MPVYIMQPPSTFVKPERPNAWKDCSTPLSPSPSCLFIFRTGLTALASFGFLAFQISRLHGRDDDAEKAKMLRRYEKARKKMA